MNTVEAKAELARQIVVMQAHLNGKEIEQQWASPNAPRDWTRATNLTWNWGIYNYRIAEDMDEKALRIYAKTAYNNETQFSKLGGAHIKRGLRVVIDAVKAGDIS